MIGAFLMSRLGIGITAILLVLALLGLQSWSDARFNAGLEAGRREAWTQAEETNKQVWVQANTAIEAQKVAATEQIAAVTERYKLATVQHKKIVETVKLNLEESEQAHEAIRPAVEAALPSTPEPVKQDLELYKQDVALLKADVVALIDALNATQQIYNDMMIARDLQAQALYGDIAQLMVERDFYKNAFHESAPKPVKKRGLFKKILIGAGIAAVTGITLGLAR
jgi:hypothetical protein